jgi:hypothetical protein
MARKEDGGVVDSNVVLTVSLWCEHFPDDYLWAPGMCFKFPLILAWAYRRCFILAGACFTLDEKLAGMIKAEFEGTGAWKQCLFGLIYSLICSELYYGVTKVVNKNHLFAM